MRKITALLLILFLPGLLLAQTMTTPPSRPIILTHVTVIDVKSGRARSEMSVIIEGGHIIAVGGASKVTVPQGAQVIDAKCKYLIPGLWDMHVHEWNKEVFFPLLIANGITGVRDMFSPLPPVKQWRAEVAAETTIGPRIFAAGILVDGPYPVCKPCTIAVSNADEGRKAVMKVKEMGADFIKVYSMVPRDAYFAIADEAKRRHMVFAGHIPEFVSAAEASDAGQKSFEHLMGILVSCSAKEKELRKENEAKLRAEGIRQDTALLEQAAALDSFGEKKAAALFARFVRNGTWMCPTLTVLRAVAFSGDDDFRNDPRIKYIPDSMKQPFWENAFGWKEHTPEFNAQAKKLFQKQLEVVGMMNRAGVRIIAGTDTANPYVFPGFSLHDELALLVQAGLTPAEALRTATINPAKYFDMEKSLGTVEKGRIADLVLLEANPLTDINNTRKIDAVIVGGKYLPKETLQKMLAEVEATANKK